MLPNYGAKTEDILQRNFGFRFWMPNPTLFYLLIEIFKVISWLLLKHWQRSTFTQSSIFNALKEIDFSRQFCSEQQLNWTLLFAITKDATFWTLNPWKNGCWSFDARGLRVKPDPLEECKFLQEK